MTSENNPDSQPVRRNVTRGQVRRYPYYQTARQISLDVIVIEYHKALKTIPNKLDKKEKATDETEK